MNSVLRKRFLLRLSCGISLLVLLVGAVRWGFAAPPVPQNFTSPNSSVANGTATVNLSWAASTGATSYKVYRAQGNVVYGTALATVTAPTLTYVDSAPAGPLYRYVVTAVDADGESGRSNEIILSTVLPTAPNRPTATPGDSSATVTWNAIAGVRHYKVYKTAYPNYPTVGTLAYVGIATTNSYVVTGLTNGVRCGFEVSAVTAAGEGNRSSESWLVIPGPLPTTPTNVVATATVGQVALSWTGGANTNNYGILRSEISGGPYQSVGGTTHPLVTFVDTTGDAGRTYYYKVAAGNNIGSRVSSEVRADLPSLGVSFSDVTGSALTVHLPDLPQYATKFNLQRAIDTPPSLFTPPASGRVCWYRADSIGGLRSGTLLAAWNEASANTKLAFQDDPDRRPLWMANAMNGRPAVRFDGLNDRLQTAPFNLSQSSVNLSVIIALRPDSVPSSLLQNSTLLDHDHANGDPYAIVGPQPSGWVVRDNHRNSAYALAGLFHATSGWQPPSPSSPVSLGQANVVTTIKSGTSSSGYLNGNALTPNAVTVASAILTGTHPLSIGNTAASVFKDTSAGHPYKGDIAEILVYNRAITSTERQDIEKYLIGKYGVRRAEPTGLTWTTIATNLDGGDVYPDTGLQSDATYWYRVVTASTPSIAGQPNHVTTLGGVVGAPAAPTFTSILTTSVVVQGVALPANAQSLVLQKRLADDPAAEFTDVRGGLANLQTVTVTNLEPGTEYAFRYVAVADGQAVPGLLATVTTKTEVIAGAGGLRGYYYARTGTGIGDPRRYFVNKRLERIDPEINFEWGNGGSEGRPAMNLPSLFSARWVGKIKPVYTETYTFFIQSNYRSQVTLWINGQQVVSKLDESGAESSGTIALTAGTDYDIRLEYHQIRDSSSVKLLWQSASQPKAIVAYNRLTANPKGAGTGLRAQYFRHRDLSSQVLSQTDKEVDFEWGYDSPVQGMSGDDFSVLWTGQVQPRYTGTYTFGIYGDQGVRLWVNNQLLVNQWTTNTTGSGTIALTAGQKYDIKIAFTEKTDLASVWLWWSSAQQFEEIVPQECLFPAATDATVLPTTPVVDDAVFLSQQVPTRIPPSTTFPVSVTFRNAGTSTWSSGGGYSLSNVDAVPAQWGNNTVALPANVIPGGSVTFTFNVTSPSTVGSTGYFTWRLNKTGVAFGDASPRAATLVDSPPPAPTVESVGATSVTLRTPLLPYYAPGYTVTGYTLQRATSTATPVTAPPTGASLWLKADSLSLASGSAVSTWSDSSASALHATQSTANQRPLFITNVLNGKPVVRFDGVDDGLVFSARNSIRTAFVVMRHNTGSQDYAAFLGHDTAAPHFHSDLGDALISATYATATVSGGSAYINGALSAPTALKKTTSWSVLSFVTTGNAIAAALGLDRNFGGRFWNGDFAEVLLYNSALSTAQRQQAEEYLGRKYNLSFPAPSGATWTTIATGLAGDALYTDAPPLTPNTTYWYRVVLEPTTPGGTGASVGVTTLPSLAAPDPPGAPDSGTVTPTTITVTAPGPSLPARAHSLNLQMRLSSKPDSSYVTVAENISAGAQTLVTDLTPQTVYRFRYVSIGLGGETASAQWAEYTTSIEAPDPPEAPSFSNITTTSMTVTLPLMPERATSLALQWKFSSQPDTAFATVATNPTVIDVPKADQAVTSLPAETEVQITQLVPGSGYSFRCVATGPGGTTNGVVAGMSAGQLPPDPPNAPVFRDVSLTSVTVVAPALPARSDALRLQGRLLQSGTSWIDIASPLEANTETPVTGLTQGALYSFRYIALGTGGATPGVSATVRLLAPVITWQAGAGIRCNGIRWPQVGATLAAGSRGKVSSYLGFDWDERITTVGTGSWSSRYTDTCTYVWSCSTLCFQNGGGFDLNGVRVQTIRAQSPIWIAPTTLGPQTLTLVVDDQNSNNKANDEGGSREDAARSYNDDPARFSITITVQ